MLFKELLGDVSPKGSGIKISANERIAEYEKKYRLFKTRIKSEIIKANGSYYALCRIPSASVKDFFYEAVVEFTELGPSIDDSKVKIFSNSPSFVYNFAYVFYNMPDEGSAGMIIDNFDKKIPEKNLTIDLTQEKISEEVLHVPPDIKNPYGIPFLDKTLYFAFFHIRDSYNVKSIKSKARYKTKVYLDNNIMSFEKTMLLRTKMQQDEVLKRAENIGLSADNKKLIRQSVEEGHNVSIRKTKKRGWQTTIKPSGAVNNIKAKAGKMNINKIKKLK